MNLGGFPFQDPFPSYFTQFFMVGLAPLVAVVAGKLDYYGCAMLYHVYEVISKFPKALTKYMDV